MAFNAGSIEATLTLNRNPFTAGLAAARNQARAFAKERYEATARIKIDTLSFDAARKQLSSFAKESRTATAKVLVERLAFDKLIRDLREFGRQTYTATARVNTGNSSRDLSDLTDAIGRAGKAADNNRNNFDRLGDSGHNAFSRMHGAARAVMLTLPALLPVAGTAITGVIGLVGALTSAMVTAGAGAAAFGLVAIPVYGKIGDALKLAKADFDQLPPGIRAGAIALKDLTHHYDLLVKSTENSVGFAIAAGLNAATAAVQTFTPVINKMGEVLTTIGREATQYFRGEHWQGFVDFLTNNMVPIWTALWDIIKHATRAVIDLTIAFGPMATWLLQAIASGMRDFAQWTSTLANDPKFHEWVELAKRSLEAMWKFLVVVVEFLFKLATALAPVGNVILGVLTKIFEALNKLPPEWLGAIAIGMAAIFTAMMLGAGGPVALAIGAVVGMATALGLFYEKNETVRKSIDGFVESVRNNFLPIWNTIQSNIRTFVIPAWERLVQVYKDELQPVVERLAIVFEEKIWPVIRKIADTITGSLIPAFLNFMTAIAPFVAFITDTIGTVAIDAIEKFGLVFDKVLKALSAGLNAWAALFRGDWDKVWENLKIGFEAWKGVIEILFGDVWRAFLKTMQEEGEILKTEWDTMWGDLGTTLEEEKDIWHDIWVNFWGGVKTTQEGEIIVVKSEWQRFLDDIGTTLDEEAKIWFDRWIGFWGGVKTEQDGSQTQVKGAWNTMWDALGIRFSEWWNKTSTEWVNFWAGFKAKADEIEAAMWAAWNKFWNDLGQKFVEWWNKTTAEWNTFWAGFAAKANEIEAQMWAAWNKFWSDLGQRFVDWWNKTTTEWNTFWNDFGATLGRWIADIQTRWNNFWNEVDRIRREIWAAIEKGIADSLAAIQREVGAAGDRIASAWRRIANFFADPIDWVIRVVLNDGILGAWNTVMGWIGQPGLSVGRIPPLPRYAEGGPIHGGIPGKDSVPILTMPGEYVLSKRAVDNLGGLRFVEGFHRNAKGSSPTVSRPQETDSGLLGFQAGGAIWQQMWNAVKGAFGNARLTSSVRPGDPGYHGKGMAIDIAGPSPMNMPVMLQINKWIASTFGASAAELIHTQLGAVNLLNGRPHTYGAGTQADHVNHVHWATTSMAGGSAGAGMTPIQVDMWTLFGGAATALMNNLLNVAGIPGAGSPVGEAAGRIPKAIIPKVLDALRKKLESIFTTQMVGGSASPNAGSMEIQNVVNSVAQGYGWGIGSAQWNALSLLIGKESSWNPNAQNPTSTAYGLFQFLNSTWASVGAAKTADPRGQTVAGLKYIAQRYGTPAAALAFHRANNWYDAGGLMQPGATMAINGTGSPEAVLTAPQWDAVMSNRANDDILRKLDQLIEAIERSGGGDTVNISGTKDPAENARRAVLALKLQRR